MKKIFPFLLAIAFMFSGINPAIAQNNKNGGKNDSEKYLQTYSAIAVKQMENYGIPASIILAQGLLESGAGKSKLAIEANNHFGIKADSRWEGKTISHFDNGNWHKFRVYRNVEKSFEDHSLFLSNNSRYSSLFNLKLTDYKEAFEKADIVVMLTAHDQFKTLPYNEDKVILDFCGIYKK